MIDKPLIRSEMRHARRLYRGWQNLHPHRREAGRGYVRQEGRRSVEQEEKKAVLTFVRWSRRLGLSRDAGAVRLGLSPETVGRWDREWREGRRHPAGRGRPVRLSTPSEQAAVQVTLRDCGPATGIPALTALFPDIARRELAALISAFRADYWDQHQLIDCLDWLVPGTVWAMDYTDTDPSRPIDATYPHMLVVRDLASGQTLLSLPVTATTAAETCRALEALFRTYNLPLVIKADNGTPVSSEAVRELLWKNSITFLLNPPYYPRYNGACEAGIGGLKVRAHHIAARNNRPGEWTCDDVEAARLQANRTSRPKGAHGPVPEEAWKTRQPVSAKTRVDFCMSVHECRREVQKEEGVLELRQADDKTQARIEREAIERALVAHAFLKVRRRRIPTPFSSLLGTILT